MIQKFSNKPEHTIKAFFQQFERATTSMNYTDAQKLNALSINLSEKPRQWFVGEWEINPTTTYTQWKSTLANKYLSEEYKQNKRYEFSQKVFSVGEDVDRFVDEMQNLFQGIDPAIPGDYKSAKIRRAINNIPDYRKFFAVAEADTVQKIRTAVARSAAINKTKTVVQQKISVDTTKVICYHQDNWKLNTRDKFSSLRNRNTLEIGMIIGIAVNRETVA